MIRRIPLAWLQLTHGRTKMLVAVMGVVFADVLMFMQLGFLVALFDSAIVVQKGLKGDLVILSPLSEAMFRMQAFPRRHLYRALSHPEVESVHPVYTGIAPWKNPWTGRDRSMFVFGVEPHHSIFGVPGADELWGTLKEPDTCLYDQFSRPEFGPVGNAILSGEDVEAEVNRHRLEVKGLVQIGASFGADGNILTSDSNFFRIFQERIPGAIDFGVLLIKPGADAQQVKKELQEMYADEIRVLTTPEFVEFEREYWEQGAPIGFIFTLGTILGFFVGFVIVYQILFTDVNQHLPQYATLKAIGYSDGYLSLVVIQEALILSVLGYIPGVLISMGLYHMAEQATFLPIFLSQERAILVFILTVVMCGFSGLMAMRKLSAADPADVF